jgi:hypothetical protein
MSKTKTGAPTAQPQGRRVCKRCDHTKPIELFKKAGTGRGHICKACDAKRASERWHADPEASRAKRRARRQRNLDKERAQAKARYWRDPEKSRAQACKRAKSERGRASNSRAVARYRHRHPEVGTAQRQARAAVRRGKIKVPTACEVRGCGRTDIHLHHERYDRPLEVLALCADHHRRCHIEGALRLKDGSRRRFVRAPRAEPVHAS